MLRFVLIVIASLVAVYLLIILISVMATYEWIPYVPLGCRRQLGLAGTPERKR
jgi:hypothetical protein